MNWISNYVRPKLKSILERKDVPENLWTTCKGCGVMINHRTMVRSMNVCPECDYHMTISPRERFDTLFDDKVYSLLEIDSPQEDPLSFRDSKRYSDRLKAAQKATEEKDAMLVAEGNIGKLKTIVAAQDFEFMAGSMGMYVGNAILAACERCLKVKAPLVLFATAGGARMQEGILSLMQMPRSTVAIKQLADPRLPYIVVLTNPTTGGVTASYAMLGDIHIAEPKALIGFAGPRVIEQTIKEKLPEGFQRSEYLLEHGMLDMVVHRKKMRETIMVLTRLLMRKSPAIRGEITFENKTGSKQSSKAA